MHCGYRMENGALKFTIIKILGWFNEFFRNLQILIYKMIKRSSPKPLKNFIYLTKVNNVLKMKNRGQMLINPTMWS